MKQLICLLLLAGCNNPQTPVARTDLPGWAVYEQMIESESVATNGFLRTFTVVVATPHVSSVSVGVGTRDCRSGRVYPLDTLDHHTWTTTIDIREPFVWTWIVTDPHYEYPAWRGTCE